MNQLPSTSRRSLFDRFRRVASVAALVALSTCKLSHIDISAGAMSTIPKKTLLDQVLGEVDFAGLNNLDFSEQFQNQGVTKDEVDSVKLKSLKLTIDDPADGTFDFLQSVTFFAEADGQPKIQIATMASVPKGVKEITLDVSADAELAPYVTAPSVTLSSQVQGSQPDEDTTVSADVVLDVEVHIPGCG